MLQEEDGAIPQVSMQYLKKDVSGCGSGTACGEKRHTGGIND
jgi:hypothetical protein